MGKGESTYTVYYESPIGIVEIKSNEDAITHINFVDKLGRNDKMIPILQEAYTQLDEYFKGKRKSFDLKLHIEGTEFQKKVWTELTKIPYGEVATYKNIAIRIGNEKAVRAVGNSNNKNKIAIIIPCHRIIGSNGKLVGYAGGLHIKEWLLNHEKKFKGIL
ncbi:methylated-DNA--[protein]-cysteine S-methyltransferase [Clostridium colicanis]|uniref:Methylated-DNA--protein-cysteine methyltransferase n=1 Tax=Clostridium colicanis DSM 13634 TaxID=1121305 RepID=A0A151AKM0_9CLOT|nr:methylated-DNA--[protein]-cysteine S-methyltransferase [Clostridium colicanis]KYH28135.1 methylated-DNA--protein-cysteine methyltransferase, constitutive [Clostridium colicanis DSM 13634]